VEKAKTRKPKKKKQKTKYTGIFFVFWLIIAGMSFSLVVGQAGRYNELREEYERVSSDIARARAMYYSLQLEIEFHDSDAYVERLARERLGMVRPNEIVFRNIAAE